MSTPSRREFAMSRLRYERDRARAWWRLATGRCPGCPKKRRGQHKFGCHRPGKMPSLRQARKGW